MVHDRLVGRWVELTGEALQPCRRMAHASTDRVTARGARVYLDVAVPATTQSPPLQTPEVDVADPAPEFRIAVVHANGGTTLDIAGDVDMATAPELGARSKPSSTQAPATSRSTSPTSPSSIRAG